jgi:hypothetical protein
VARQGREPFPTLPTSRLAWSAGEEQRAPEPRSIVALLDERVLDAQLAALLWLLVEARIPLVVAGEGRGVGKTTLLAALLDFLPLGVRTEPLIGAMEDFGWLPEAPELGWRPDPSRVERARTPLREAVAGARTKDEVAMRFLGGHERHRVDPQNTVLLVHELSPDLPEYTWGPHARVAIRALSIGYGMAATIPGSGLEDVFDHLRKPPVRLSEDELSMLGVVLVLRFAPYAETAEGTQQVRPQTADGAEPNPQRRVVAAHYVRPIVRDQHGHLQRMPPAVLAVHEPRTDQLEHFAWGIIPELAHRVGSKPGDFELEQERRSEYLTGLQQAGIVDVATVRTAIAGYREVPGHPVA